MVTPFECDRGRVRWLNFVALALLGAYIVKRYVLPDIAAEMKQKQQDEIARKKQLCELELRSIALARADVQQDVLCTHLVKQAETWRDAYDRDQAHQESLRKQWREKAEVRRGKQAQALFYERVTASVVPQALHQLSHDLQMTFTDADKGKLFIDTIASHMRRIL